MAHTYDDHKSAAAALQREKSAKGREIGEIPKPLKPKRRSACRNNFQRFCETYYPLVFNLDWSADHVTVIKRIETATINGGLFALAMPRGSGKTSLCTAAAVWALLYGHRSYVVLIGATKEHAKKLLTNITEDLNSNDLLNEDFPEVCYPIRRLERIVARQAGQTYKGKSTSIEMTAESIVLPTIPKSNASGGRIEVAGLTGSFRGMQAKREGATIRPDFVLIDDPQTDESARSPKQIADRLDVIKGGIINLAGPDVTISGVMPVTVIARGDLADQVLDRKKFPQWQGQRTKLLKSLPTNVKLWEEYAELRAKSYNEHGDIRDATKFYEANRVTMDAGAEASWPQRYEKGEASAVQYAMNKKLTDEASFAAEFQNEPLALDLDTPLILTPNNVYAAIIDNPKIGRSVVPLSTTKLTAFIDVQASVLYYAVCAFDSAFNCTVIEYGCWPKQQRSYFYLREVSPTLQDRTTGSLEQQIYNGLVGLTDDLMGRLWEIEDGNAKPIKVDRILIDSGYEASTVKNFCSRTAYASTILPTKGYGITADKQPLNSWSKKPSMREGWNWRAFNIPERYMLYDTNAWKTFVAQRLLTAKGGVGTLSVYHATAVAHRMFAEHVSSEYPNPTEGQGRVVNVWKLRPNRENHLLDCLIGCYVAASEQGVLFLGHIPAKAPKPRRQIEVSY